MRESTSQPSPGSSPPSRRLTPAQLPSTYTVDPIARRLGHSARLSSPNMRSGLSMARGMLLETSYTSVYERSTLDYRPSQSYSPKVSHESSRLFEPLGPSTNAANTNPHRNKSVRLSFELFLEKDARYHRVVALEWLWEARSTWLPTNRSYRAIVGASSYLGSAVLWGKIAFLGASAPHLQTPPRVPQSSRCSWP